MKIRFVPRDCWVGLYWQRSADPDRGRWVTRWYLCLVPCLPICWTTARAASDEEAAEMGQETWLQECERECRCCWECSDVPCDGLLCGGICEQRCDCDERDRDDDVPF